MARTFTITDRDTIAELAYNVGLTPQQFADADVTATTASGSADVVVDVTE